MMRVSVFGLGYVGCVSAACLARAGHKVIGVDTNAEKVAMVNGGISPIVEPGLEEVLQDGVTTGRLSATTSSVDAVSQTEMALICVGTPSSDNGQLNVDALQRVCMEIGQAINISGRPFTVVIRSTCLPGAIDNVVLPGLLAGAGGKFRSAVRVGVNPEFIREGSALKDFNEPPMILAGSDNIDVDNSLRHLYKGINAPFISTDIKTAEMVKYASNAFHALKICFANEMGDICNALGVDAQEVMRIFRQDRKLNISEAYLRPGFAFGGSCLPKDLRSLVYAANHADVSIPVISSMIPSNDAHILNTLNKVLKTRKRRIGLVGLSFKPGTDDLRESPLVALAEMLIGKGCDVRILDRNVSIAKLTGANRRYIEEEIPHISSLMCKEVNTLLAHAEVLVIGNDSEEASQVLEEMRPQHYLIDLTRGAIKPVIRQPARRAG